MRENEEALYQVNQMDQVPLQKVDDVQVAKQVDMSQDFMTATRNINKIWQIDKDKDSRYMQRVKNSINELNTALQKANGTAKDLSKLDDLYEAVLQACDAYIEDKEGRIFRTYSEARLRKVRNAKDLYKREFRWFRVLTNRRYADENLKLVNNSVIDSIYAVQKDQTDPVQSLEFKDFLTVISDKKDDRVICRDGKLCRVDVDYLNGDEEMVCHENYDMALRLVDILTARQATVSDVTRNKMKRNLLRKLGADFTKEVCGPVRMMELRSLIIESNKKLSKVDKALLYSKKADQGHLAIARQIDNLLGSALSPSKNISQKQHEKNLKKQIKDIMSYCKAHNNSEEVDKKTGKAKKIWPMLQTMEGSEELILAGQLQAVRDKVYESALRIYDGKKRLAGDEDADGAQLSDNDLKILFGMAISQTLAMRDPRIPESRKYYEIVESGIKSFEESHIFDQELAQTSKSLRIDSLMMYSSDFVKSFIDGQMGRWEKKGWVENSRNLKADRDTVCKIIDNLKQLNDLQTKGLVSGLSQEEARLMDTLGYWIDTDLGANNGVVLTPILELLNRDKKNKTFLAQGLKSLQAKIKKNPKYFQNAANILSNRLKTAEPQKPKPQADLEEQEIISEIKATAHAMEVLSSECQKSTAIFIDKIRPTELIKKKGSQDCVDLLRLYAAIRDLRDKKKESVDITLGADKMTLAVDEDTDILYLRAEDHKIELPYNAATWATKLSADIAANLSRFNMKQAKAFLKNISNPNNELNRDILEAFLRGSFGDEAANYINLSTETIAKIIFNFAKEERTQKSFKLISDSLQAEALKEANKTHITSAVIDENVLAAQNRSIARINKIDQANKMNYQPKEDKRVVDMAGYKEKELWTVEERQALDLISELFSTSKTWKKYEDDNAEQYTAKRIVSVLRNNQEGFKALLSVDISNMLLTFKLAGLEPATNAITNFVSQIKQLEGFAPQSPEKLLNGNSLNECAGTLAAAMDTAVNTVADSMQGKLNTMSQQMGDIADVDKWKNLFDWKLDDIVEQGLAGEDGEGGFNRLVLSGYIDKANQVDKRNMLAAALKYAPKVTLGELANLDDEKKAAVAGKFLSGYIKGAGPLLHKMMQQLPVSDMETSMREAVSDVRNNLSKIDEEIIDAQLDRMIEQSGGRIVKIEKKKLLGAASVGQTVDVVIYEKGAKEGKERVIKFLRPDVDNHMKREMDFMLSCAKEVDKKTWQKANNKPNDNPPADYMGGMEKTYRNKLETITKELNLTDEGKNIIEGQLYNDPLSNLKSMKLDETFSMSKEMLVLEKADGETVNEYTKKQDALRQDIEKKLEEEQDTDSGYGCYLQLNDLRNELLKKREFLDNLMKKWSDEALFGSGFFHGDLHAGNMMIDDEGITLIDFGNASKLTEAEQAHVLNLLAAANTNRATSVINHLTDMLDSANKALYMSKKDLEGRVRDIVKKEDDDPAKKLLAVVNEFQREGIEVPKSLYNFIQCLTRLVGTMKDYDTLIKNVDTSMNNILDYKGGASMDQNPAAPILSQITRDIKENIKNQKEDQEKKHRSHVVIDERKIEIDQKLDKYAKEPPINYNILLDKTTNLKEFLYDSKLIYMGPAYDRWHKVMSGAVGSSFMPVMSLGQGFFENSYRLLFDETEDFKKYFNSNKMKYRPEEFCFGLCGLLGSFIDEEKNPQLRGKIQDFLAQIGEDNWKNVELTEAQRFVREAMSLAEEFMNALDFSNNESEKIFAKSDKNPEETKARQEQGRKYGICLLKRLFFTYHGKDDIEDSKNAGSADVTKETQKKIIEKHPEINEATENLKKAFKELYLDSVGGPDKAVYKYQMISQVILNKDKFTTLEKSLKSWFEDANNKGEELKQAYDGIAKKYQENQKLEQDSPEISTFVDLFLDCIKGRAEKIKAIEVERASNNKQDFIDKLKADRLGDMGRKLDKWGLGYYFVREYKLPQVQKDNKTLESMQRKSAAREKLAKSLNSINYKNTSQVAANAIHALKQASDKWGQLKPEEKKQCIDDLNAGIKDVLNTLVNKIEFMDSEKKKIKERVEKFLSNPSVEDFVQLVNYANKLIDDNFEGTVYSFTQKDYDDMRDKLGKRQKDKLLSNEIFSERLRGFVADGTKLPKDKISSKWFDSDFNNEIGAYDKIVKQFYKTNEIPLVEGDGVKPFEFLADEKPLNIFSVN